MQSKRPRFNPLILALALAAVLMVWSVLGGTGSASSSSMEYSTVVHYFESLQVTQFSLDLDTGVITMDIKEVGKNNLPLPDTTAPSTTQATGGLLSGMLSSSDSTASAAQKNSDGTVTVRYKLPYASMFVKYVGDYIAAYDAANPDAPMVYDYTPVKESIPWMEILFLLVPYFSSPGFGCATRKIMRGVSVLAFVFGATDSVMNELPPMTELAPMTVLPPRMDAPE